MHQIDPESETITPDEDSLYLYVNNDIEYRLFEDIVDSYYLDSQIKDNFQCDCDCYSQHNDPTIDGHSNTCTHEYHHIAQTTQDLSDSTQQNTLHSIEENASLFTDDTMTSAKLMNDTPIEIFIDNGATPSILPLCTYNRFPIYTHIPEQKVIFQYIQEEV